MPEVVKTAVYSSNRYKLLGLIFCLWTAMCLLTGSFARHQLLDSLPSPFKALIANEHTLRLRELGERYTRLESTKGQSQFRKAEWLAYATTAENIDNPGEAVLAYHKILSQEPKDSEVMHKLANLYLSSQQAHIQDPHSALNWITKAYELNPSASICYTYAKCVFQLNNHKLAASLLNEASNHSPHKITDQEIKLLQAQVNLALEKALKHDK